MVWRWDAADPFGAAAANQDPNNLGTPLVYNPRFPGQVFDQETATHYNFFRNYDPGIGRYVQSDPIGMRGGINSYRYVYNNPAFYSDTSGLAADRDDCTIIATTNGALSDQLLGSKANGEGTWKLFAYNVFMTQSRNLILFLIAYPAYREVVLPVFPNL